MRKGLDHKHINMQKMDKSLCGKSSGGDYVSCWQFMIQLTDSSWFVLWRKYISSRSLIERIKLSICTCKEGKVKGPSEADGRAQERSSTSRRRPSALVWIHQNN